MCPDPIFDEDAGHTLNFWCLGGETKYTIAKRLTTALELQSTHSTSDAVVTQITE